MNLELEKINNLIDKLTLEALMLMEQHIQTKLKLETAMCDGEAHLVKSRYIMGQSSVSALQLPSAESQEVEAIARVYPESGEQLFGQKSWSLDIRKKPSSGESGASYCDPLKWFGILVPSDLHQAQASYRRALQWCVIGAGLQTQLHETCVKIQQLKDKAKELKA